MQGEAIFQNDSVMEARVKGKKKTYNIDRKIPIKIWFHYPPTYSSI